MAAFGRLTNPKWFDRMWLGLEYLHGKDDFIISQQYAVMSFFAHILSDGINKVIGEILS